MIKRTSDSKRSIILSIVWSIAVLILAYFSGLLYMQKNKNGNNNSGIIQEHLILDDIMPPSGNILKSIAIPRVSGTTGNEQVRSFIKSNFKEPHWTIEEDVHVMDSGHGASTLFTNLIVTFNSNSNNHQRIVLAAHYDSKLLEAEGFAVTESVQGLQSEFIGALDSAWSCSLMIAIARAIESEAKHDSSASFANFQLIFFDGEEAVRTWTQTDSLYGSRGLATKWSKLPDSSFNSLKNIKVLVLLDLLGATQNEFYDFNPIDREASRMFRDLAKLEFELFGSNVHFQSSRQFDKYSGAAVEDDHTPFLPFGVPILHLIPLPFPDAWHNPKDTIEALNPETCSKLSQIIYKFIRRELHVR